MPRERIKKAHRHHLDALLKAGYSPATIVGEIERDRTPRKKIGRPSPYSPGDQTLNQLTVWVLMRRKMAEDHTQTRASELVADYLKKNFAREWQFSTSYIQKQFRDFENRIDDPNDPAIVGKWISSPTGHPVFNKAGKQAIGKREFKKKRAL